MVYVRSSSTCYHMKINTPKRFKDDKKSPEYKKWKKAKDKEYDEKARDFEAEEWWNSKNEKEQKELLKKYKTKEVAKSRFLYWAVGGGTCKGYRVLKL